MTYRRLSWNLFILYLIQMKSIWPKPAINHGWGAPRGIRSRQKLRRDGTGRDETGTGFGFISRVGIFRGRDQMREKQGCVRSLEIKTKTHRNQSVKMGMLGKVEIISTLPDFPDSPRCCYSGLAKSRIFPDFFQNSRDKLRQNLDLSLLFWKKQGKSGKSGDHRVKYWLHFCLDFLSGSVRQTQFISPMVGLKQGLQESFIEIV